MYKIRRNRKKVIYIIAQTYGTMWERREGVVVRLTCWVFAVQFSAKQYMPLFIYLFIYYYSESKHSRTHKYT